MSTYEMVTLRKARSGLPVNIYLDDSGSYAEGEDGPIIKFQYDNGNSPNTHSLIPMTISDAPEIPIDNYNTILNEFRNDDIFLIKYFVIINKTNLLRLCDCNDEYDFFDFLSDMVRVP